MKVLKHVYPGICFIIVLCCMSNILKAQNRDRRYDRELVTFMNYIRDSVLKTDSWADDSTMGLGRFAGYTPPNFGHELYKKCNGIFTNEEIDYILQEIRDTSAYIPDFHVLKYARRKATDTMSLYFHRLYIIRSELGRYVFNNLSLQFFPTEKKINDDTLKLISDNFEAIVRKKVQDYNNTIDIIKAFKKYQMYRYAFKAPVFLKRFNYCVLEYCDYRKFDFYINLYKQKHRKWMFVKTISFFSEIIQY